MVKEYVLIARQEYEHLKDIPTTNDSSESKNVTDSVVKGSMLSIQQLIRTVKQKVGTLYHNKVDRLFEFLSAHPTILTWTNFGEAIVDGVPVTGSNVYDMLVYLFHDWRKLSKQSPPQGLDKLTRSLFQNGYDPRNVVNRRVKFLNCGVKENK